MTASRHAGDGERGSTLLLTLVYGLLAIALILVVVSATSLYLERKRLFTLADGAALAGAEAFDLGSLEVSDGEVVLELSDAAVRAAALAYLDDAEHGLHELALVDAAAPDGTSARVTLSAVWEAPFSTEFVPVRVPIEVAVDARAVVH